MQSPRYSLDRKRLAVACLVAGPLLMLAGDLMGLTSLVNSPERYTVLRVSCLVYLGVALALGHLARLRSPRLALAGMGVTLAGAFAGGSIITLDIVKARAVANAFDAASSEAVQRAVALAAREIILYPIPGLAFPMGLVLLAVALYRSGVAPAWQPTALALAAILFPVGRIPRIVEISVLSDVLFLVSLAPLALRAARWSAEAWEDPPAAGEAARERAAPATAAG